MRYREVHAFTAQEGGGNPAAVIVLEAWPANAELARIAAEIGLPATGFVVRDDTASAGGGGGADWEICWFSPSAEIQLCGHATLACGHVLMERDGGESVRLRTRKSGIVEMRRDGSGYALALPAIAGEPVEHPEVAALMGMAPLSLHRSALGYTILLYRSEAELRALSPDMARLAALSSDQFIATARGESTDIVSRVFTQGVEDSVTGSAHAALAPYWSAKLQRTSFTAHQASERGGDLTLRLDGARVWLGGQCVTVGEGSIAL